MTMMSATKTALASEAPEALELDAVVIGAGVAGLYQLYQLREQGLKVRAYDAASDVGGTWYWNRYPGARFDSEAYIYQYLFSEELYKGWSWSERFPGQPEIEQLAALCRRPARPAPRHPVQTTITSAHFDEDRGRWTDKHRPRRHDRHAVLRHLRRDALGADGEPLPGPGQLQGPIFHTSPLAEGGRGPRRQAGRRGRHRRHRHPGHPDHRRQGRAPDRVRPHAAIRAADEEPEYDEAGVDAYKARFDELKATLPHTFTGFEYDFEHALGRLTPEQRREILEEIYEDGSLKLWLACFGEMFFDEDVNEEISEFVREKMRERLKDQRLFDLLIPKDYGFGTHRVPLETQLSRGLPPAQCRGGQRQVQPDRPRSCREGIQLADGTVHELDVIILATGFDAGTGALTRIDIRGRDGRR